MNFDTLVILVVVTFHAYLIHWNIRQAEKNITNKIVAPIYKGSFIANFLLTFLIVAVMYLLRFLYNLVY